MDGRSVDPGATLTEAEAFLNAMMRESRALHGSQHSSHATLLFDYYRAKAWGPLFQRRRAPGGRTCRSGCLQDTPTPTAWPSTGTAVCTMKSWWWNRAVIPANYWPTG